MEPWCGVCALHPEPLSLWGSWEDRHRHHPAPSLCRIRATMHSSIFDGRMTLSESQIDFKNHDLGARRVPCKEHSAPEAVTCATNSYCRRETVSQSPRHVACWN